MVVPERAADRPLRGRPFGRVGTRGGPARVGGSSPYFVTGADARLAPRSGLLPAFGSAVHAKEMGTLVTACGLSAASWTKLWDVPFSPSHGRACRACAEVVRAR